MKTLLAFILISLLALFIYSVKALTAEGFFICAAILMGSCLIGLASMTKRESRTLHRDFDEFSKALEDGPQKEEELAKKVGKTSRYASFDATPEFSFSEGQAHSL